MKLKKWHNLLNSTMLHFGGLEFLFWATCAAYYPFQVLFLMNKGYSSTTIGIIVAINSIIIVFAQPFWGMVSDWVQSVKKVFIFILFISACTLLLLPLFDSVLVIGLMLAIVSFFESSMAPLLDSWVISAISNEKNIAYGSIRLWGSLGYALLVYILSHIIDKTSVNIIFPAYAILGLFTILLSMRINDNPSLVPLKISELKIGRLLTSYYYIVFLIFATGLFVPHRAVAIFLPKMIQEVGGGDKEIGMSYAILALSEIPIFIVSKYLIQKYKPIYLILVSTIFFVLRQMLLLFATNPLQIILLQSLQGPSYALFLTGTVYYIHSLAPQELKSTAQTIGSAVFCGASSIIGSYGGGWFIDNLGIASMYQTGAIIAIITTLLFILSFPLGKWLFRKGLISCSDAFSSQPE